MFLCALDGQLVVLSSLVAVVLKETLQAKTSWTSEPHLSTQIVQLLLSLWWLLSRCMSALSVLSFALDRNASHHEHPCAAVVLTLAWHLFIRVDTASEVAHELIAEPIPEPQAGEQQENAVEHAPEEVTNPADLQGKPRCITLNFNIQYLLYIYCAFRFLWVDWNLRCMIPRFPQSLY